MPLNSPDLLDSIASIVAAFGEKAKFDEGTVLDVAQVTGGATTEARLVVSPDFNVDVIRAT